MNRIGILKNTLEIFKNGYYYVGDSYVPLRLTPSEYAKVHYWKENEDTVSETAIETQISTEDCKITVKRKDTFEAAIDMKYRVGESKRILVLNFANPINPGGGVRYGAVAQEEDLCRRSSLLFSLESQEAAPFYRYHADCCDSLASDSILLSPNVEIIRDRSNLFLPKSEVVSVITCAAPIKHGVRYHSISTADYAKLLYGRIKRILQISSICRYSYLVLGAWGCGSFGNDAQLVAHMFHSALNERIDGGQLRKNKFREIEFAVLSNGTNDYNYQSFYQTFYPM